VQHLVEVVDDDLETDIALAQSIGVRCTFADLGGLLPYPLVACQKYRQLWAVLPAHREPVTFATHLEPTVGQHASGIVEVKAP
jgi:hypothetical protein